MGATVHASTESDDSVLTQVHVAVFIALGC